MIIPTKQLLDFLNSVHLNNLVEECVLDTEEGIIQTIDITGSIFIHSTIDALLGDELIGIGNLTLLTKYLGKISSENITIEINENKLVLNPEGTKSKFKFLLSDPEVIPNTISSEKDMKKSFEKNVEATIKINDTLKSEILLYSSLVDSNSITLRIKKRKLFISGGVESEHSFNINVGKLKNTDIEDCKMDFYKLHIVSILSILSKPKFHICVKKPLIITEGNRRFYALMPQQEV